MFFNNFTYLWMNSNDHFVNLLGMGPSCSCSDCWLWRPNVPWLCGADPVPGATVTINSTTCHCGCPSMSWKMSLSPHHLHWPRITRFVSIKWLDKGNGLAFENQHQSEKLLASHSTKLKENNFLKIRIMIWRNEYKVFYLQKNKFIKTPISAKLETKC